MEVHTGHPSIGSRLTQARASLSGPPPNWAIRSLHGDDGGGRLLGGFRETHTGCNSNCYLVDGFRGPGPNAVRSFQKTNHPARGGGLEEAISKNMLILFLAKKRGPLGADFARNSSPVVHPQFFSDAPWAPFGRTRMSSWTPEITSWRTISKEKTRNSKNVHRVKKGSVVENASEKMAVEIYLFRFLVKSRFPMENFFFVDYDREVISIEESRESTNKTFVVV